MTVFYLAPTSLLQVSATLMEHVVHELDGGLNKEFSWNSYTNRSESH